MPKVSPVTPAAPTDIVQTARPKAPEMTQEQELETLFPVDTAFSTDTIQFNIKSFPLRHLKRVLELVKQYRGLIDGGNVLDIVMEHGDSAVDDFTWLASICSGVSEQEIQEQLSSAEAIELYCKVIEVNSSFFVQSIQRGFGKVAASVSRLGPKP
jgi:hypothetical protein